MMLDVSFWRCADACRLVEMTGWMPVQHRKKPGSKTAKAALKGPCYYRNISKRVAIVWDGA